MPLPYIAMTHLWQESEWYGVDNYLPEIGAMMFGWDLPPDNRIMQFYIALLLLLEYDIDSEDEYEDMFDIDPSVATMEATWEAFKSA